jgi:hypothetical protein
MMTDPSLIRPNEVYHNSERRTLSEDKSMLPGEITNIHHSSEKHVCSTCKEEIIDISRVLIMRDRDGGPRLLCFHFFYPCWDMELLCQKYPNLIIDRTGLSFPENLVMSKSSIKKIQKNQEFWI